MAYPGTPSTETLEAFAKTDGVYAEWCVNEKVAIEVGIGASVAGARVLSTMKHVGVNVAADPLFTAAYSGVGGGLVVLAADDPGMYSSQNEQDSHWYARAAHIPMLDPADSAEALRFTREAYDVSERLRRARLHPFHSARVAHENAGGARRAHRDRAQKPEVGEVGHDARVRQAPPQGAAGAHRRAARLGRGVPYEVVRKGSAVGVVCAGAVYQHVVEALPDASVFKLGLTWPLPQQALRDFAESVDALYVVEEASEYLDEGVRALGIEVAAFESPLPRDGELTPGLIRAAFGFEEPAHEPLPAGLPGRPPALCAGCPHRLVFKELSRMKAVVTGDIGCYTLGALPPLSAMDTTIDMGASVSMSHGFELAWAGTDHRPVVGVIGDSTFAHSGLSALISTVYNQGRGTVCVLDNRTTAMTGRQGNPFNGETLQGRLSRELDLEGVVRAIGVEDVRTVDPNDAKAVRRALKEAVASEELSVLVFRSPCVLIDRHREPAYAVTDATGRATCARRLSAIAKDPANDHALIDAAQCIGCGQCAQYCAWNAIAQPAGEKGGVA